jgi:hypothetical protein
MTYRARLDRIGQLERDLFSGFIIQHQRFESSGPGGWMGGGAGKLNTYEPAGDASFTPQIDLPDLNSRDLARRELQRMYDSSNRYNLIIRLMIKLALWKGRNYESEERMGETVTLQVGGNSAEIEDNLQRLGYKPGDRVSCYVHNHTIY